jgi:hypothetical protein
MYRIFGVELKRSYIKMMEMASSIAIILLLWNGIVGNGPLK